MERPRFSSLYLLTDNGNQEEVMVYFDLADDDQITIEHQDGTQEQISSQDFWDRNPMPVKTKREY